MKGILGKVSTKLMTSTIHAESNKMATVNRRVENMIQNHTGEPNNRSMVKRSSFYHKTTSKLL